MLCFSAFTEEYLSAHLPQARSLASYEAVSDALEVWLNTPEAADPVIQREGRAVHDALAFYADGHVS